MVRMKKSTLKRAVKGMALVAVFPLLLAGCSGSDGSSGINGTNGTNGTDGTNGTNATLSGTHYLDANNVDLSVSDLTVTNAAGTPQVSFHVDAGSTGLAGLALSRFRFYMADLVPAGASVTLPDTTVYTSPAPYYEQWASETSSSGGVLKDNGSGNYTYTFTSNFGAATAASGLYVTDYDATHPQRLVLRVSGATETDGTVTNNTVGILDFMVPATGASATAASMNQFQKASVTIDTCKECHGAKMENAAHASGYLDTRACVICHSPLYGSSRHAVGFMVEDYAVLDQMVHEIHGAVASPGLGVERKWNLVTFPQNNFDGKLTNCSICHSDPAGVTEGTAATIDNWKNNPFAQACLSCHTTADLYAGATFVGLDGVSKTHPAQTSDANCHVCHTNASTGALPTISDPSSIVVAHDPTKASNYDMAADMTAPEFVATITMDPPANVTATDPGFYVAGETPTVTVTLTDAVTGAAVDSTIYTTDISDATSAAGVIGGALNGASLYVYGPRAEAVPVLTTNSTTDPAAVLTPPSLGKQGVDIRTNAASTDPLYIAGDANGFHYQLQAIPTGMTAGTYVASVQIKDYGTVSATDWKAVTSGLITFRIGSKAPAAADSDKVAGDACVNCHGNTKMHVDGSAGHSHNVPFDTDYCNSCHDRALNHGDPIANRVHAVHSASKTGDMAAIDHSDVTFPRVNGNCSVCHTSGNTSYRTNIYGPPCYGCHADNTGAVDHMAENGFIMTNQNTFTTTDSCVVCHGPGRIADVTDQKL